MSPLKTFAGSESWIDTNVNPGIEDIPGVFLHACSGLHEFKGKTAIGQHQVAAFEVAPLCGNCLCIAMQAWVASGSGEVWFELEQGGLTAEIWHLSGITGTTAPSPGQSSVFDLTAVTSAGGVNMGDLTGTDVIIRMFCDPDVKVRNVRIWTGDSSSAGDYGV
jgi:hypothetical protein